MYFWKINELKKQIVVQGLSEAQIFRYILIYVALSAAAIEVVAYFPDTESNVWSYVESGVSFLIPVIGTIGAYYANGGARGNAFAAKYFSISFVMLVRFLVYLIPLIVVLAVYYGFIIYESSPDDEQVMQTGWFEVVLMSSWLAAMYVRIGQHMRYTK
jgi:hypothetical protein